MDGCQGVSDYDSGRFVSNSAAAQFWLIDDGGTSEAAVNFTPPDISQPVRSIKETIDTLRSKLQGHATRLPAFAANLEKIHQITSAVASAEFRNLAQLDNTMKTFTTSLKTLVGSDQPILDDITAATTALEAARTAIGAAYQGDSARVLMQALPNFIFHSTNEDHIPNEVNVADFVADSDGTSRGMLNLCRAAGLSIQKIGEPGGHD